MVGGSKQGRDREEDVEVTQLGFRCVWGWVRHLMRRQRRAKHEVTGVEHTPHRERPVRGAVSEMAGDWAC